MTCWLIARLISTAATMADGTAHYAEKVGNTQQYVTLLFNAKNCFYISIKYTGFTNEYLVGNSFQTSRSSFTSSQLNGFKY